MLRATGPWRLNSIFCKVNFVHIHCTRNRSLIRIVLVPKRNESLFLMWSVFCQSLNSHSCFICTFFHRGSFDDLPNQVKWRIKHLFYTLRKQLSDICRRHHWVPSEMSERRNSTLMTSYYLDLKCFWLVVPQGKFASTNQKYHPRLLAVRLFS